MPGEIILLQLYTINEELLVILGHFLPFDPPNNPKNNKF